MQHRRNGHPSPWSYVERGSWYEYYYDGRYMYSVPRWLGSVVVTAFLLAWLVGVAAMIDFMATFLDLWTSFAEDLTSVRPPWPLT
jgi:hypothetical protein